MSDKPTSKVDEVSTGARRKTFPSGKTEAQHQPEPRKSPPADEGGDASVKSHHSAARPFHLPIRKSPRQDFAKISVETEAGYSSPSKSSDAQVRGRSSSEHTPSPVKSPAKSIFKRISESPIKAFSSFRFKAKKDKQRPVLSSQCTGPDSELELSPIEKPSSPSEIGKPSSPSEIEKPSSPSEIEKPTSPSEIEKPTSPSEIEKPTSSTAIEKPTSSTAIEKPTSPSQIEKPSNPTQIEKSSSPSITEKPSSRRGIQKCDSFRPVDKVPRMSAPYGYKLKSCFYDLEKNKLRKSPVPSECYDNAYEAYGYFLSWRSETADFMKGDRINYYNSLPEDKVIPTYLTDRNCYSVMPISGKVIVLYSNLLVRNAFSALVTNDMRAASVYDSSISSFVGMLTITDFIKVLRHYYYKSQEDIKDIENQTIDTWKTLTKSKKFIQVYPKESLLNGTKIMIKERIHRLPVYDAKRHGVVFILTKRKLLQYLYDTLMSRFGRGLTMPSFLKKPLSELKSELGTWENIATVTKESRVIDALDLFIKRGVSALPGLDKGLFTFIYRKFDVFRLAKDQTYSDLDMTIGEALDKSDEEEVKNVFACTMEETFLTVIYRLVTSKGHQLVVIDGKQMLLGIISLSDVLKFLVCNPLEDSTAQPDVIEEAPEGAVGGSEISDVFLGSGAVGGAEISDVFVSAAECSVSSLRSSSPEKRDSPTLSEEIAKLQLGADTANVADTSSCIGESKEDPQE